MTKIGTKAVPYEGPSDYDLMIVGEAPGNSEVSRGRPFIGRAGELLERYLNRNGILREDVMLANLCKYQPAYNKFNFLIDSPQLEEGLNDLQEEVKRAKPNLILALGNWPLYYITRNCGTRGNKPIPGTGIQSYRGSVLKGTTSFIGTKVYSTFHPSFVDRVWFWNPVFNIDIAGAAGESRYPEIRIPPIEEHIDPTSDKLHDLVTEALDSPWISTDIETFPSRTFSCIGFSFQRDGLDVGVCVTYQRPDLWRFMKTMWESDTPKILQYGTYDQTFMNRFYQWKLGGYYNGLGWDTYVASANLFPDYPRSLGFLNSIYTPFPYYKEDRKEHKQTGNMMSLWKYNIQDCVSTYHVAMGQQEEMQELYQ